MPRYTNCPNCAKEGLTVPLSKKDEQFFCALCENSFQNIKTQEK